MPPPAPYLHLSLKAPYHLGCSRLAGGMVVCSTCGNENPVGNRFCGMCGTPLPHPPLTTPGAQSTASLTRPLAESAGPIETRASAVALASTGLEVKPRPDTSDQGE